MVVEAGDFAEVFEVASAAGAGEGFFFGEMRWEFGALVEVAADLLTGFFGGTSHEAVVAHSGKSFGQDVEEPAPYKFVWVEVED